MRDTNTREKFARNLGHILASRKNRLNFSDLVVRAGISKNDDPNRLGRFRILPGRKANEKSIGRLSQDPLAYYRIVQETALITEENPHDLLLELIIGTKFEGKELAEVSIEPFEQLLALVRKKIDVLDAKYDLTSYFKNLRQYEILPVWESGPYCSGRRTSHHSYKRSNCVSWQATTFNEFQSWRYQIMPCVPLCRVPSGSTKSLDVNYTVGRKTFDETWNVFRRLYLAIGMFDHEYSVPTGEVVRENEELGPIEVWEAKFVEDSAPRPYLVTAPSRGHGRHFHLDPEWPHPDTPQVGYRRLNSLLQGLRLPVEGYVRPVVGLAHTGVIACAVDRVRCFAGHFWNDDRKLAGVHGLGFWSWLIGDLPEPGTKPRT